MVWHVAVTHPFGGRLAEEHLALQGYNAFNPKVKIQRSRSRGRLSEYDRPYIPGYIFAEVVGDQPWQPINYTRGIKRIMYVDAFLQKPAIIPLQVLEALQALCGGDGYLKQVEADAALMRVGRTVRISDGSFEGFEGPITWSQGMRIRVLLRFLGTAREVEVKKDSVEVTAS